MKKKTFKRCIAILLCMVIVIGLGRGYLLAESVQDEIAPDGLELVTDDSTDVEETVEVDLPEEEESETETDDAQEDEEEAEDADVSEDETKSEDTGAQEDETKSEEADVQDDEKKSDEAEDSKEEPVLQLTYEDDKVKVVVDAAKAGNIPDGATLSVTPIEKKEITSSMSEEEKEEAKAINEQYEETEELLQKKSEDEEYNIIGFLAYDIKLVDAEENEVEPNGDVKVSLEYKETEVPESVKNAVPDDMEVDVDVTVMHLEENASGEVEDVVDMVADKNEEAEVQTTSENEVQAASFTTDSFSTYTITWKGNYLSSNLNAKVVDTKGTEIGTGYTATIQSETAISSLAETIDGYEFVKAVASTSSGLTSAIAGSTSISKVKADFDYYNWEFVWKYKTGNSSWQNLDDKLLYFVYEETSTEETPDATPETDAVVIKDDLVQSGALEAVTTLTEGTTIVKYEWFKSNTQNGTYTAVERVEYKGDKSNLASDGTKLYPAFDSGAQKWYKVKVTVEGANGVTTLESKAVQVAYYDELKNGSFETPVVPSGINLQWSNEKYKSAGGVWQTTGVGSGSKYGMDIEVVDSQNSSTKEAYKWNGSMVVPDGVQFAELNCEAAGALYQDVLTMEGTSLNYWLSHRARGSKQNSTKEYDTMFLVIMPTKIATENNLTTQTNLNAYLKGLGVNYESSYSEVKDSVIYNQNGVLVVQVTSNDQAWHTVSAVAGYTPVASLTRFFFMSGKTASNDNTIGNFLDKVGFSQELPPVNDDEFTIQIEKKFEGLGSSDIESIRKNLVFEIKVVNKENGKELTSKEVEELLGKSQITGSEMTQKVDGSLVYAFNNKKISSDAKYEVTFTEKNAELTGHSLTVSTKTKVTVGEKMTQNTDSAVIETLEGKAVANVTFTNAYAVANYKNIHFTKVWDDNNNKWNTRPDSLTVTLHAYVSVEKNGVMVEEKLDDLTQTAVLTSVNDWECSWTTPVYYQLDNGSKVKIQYKVTEGTINSDYVYISPSNGVSVSGDGTAYSYSNFDKVKTTGDVESVVSRFSLRTASLAMYGATSATTTTTSTLGEPAHRKYISYNANTAEYTLNLDVTGAKGTATGVDILFVIDTSGSMGTGQGGQYTNLLPSVKSLLTQNDGIIDKIFAKSGNVNSAAFVSFASKSQTKSSTWYTTSSKETMKSDINKLKADGGTNWTYAMQMASTLLAQKSNSENEKVVIFLSDGAPTYTIKYGSEYGTGSSTDSSYYTDAANVVKNSSSLANATIYSVYLTDGTKTGMKTFSDKLTNSELVNGTNLSNALTEILNKVIPTYKNVTITDTLSEYVEFTETDPTITVTKKTASGVTTTLSSSQYEATVTGKKVEVKLLNGESLEDGATYTISFKVKPSELANTTYASQGYLHTGEADTGVTSAGKDGFYSNNDSQTTLKYEIDGLGEGIKTTDYPMPVVQVTTHTLSYEKQWNKPEGVETPTTDIVLNVNYTDGTTNVITLTAANGYKFTESVPVTKKIASITENPVADYTPSYSVSADGRSAVVTNSYSKVTSNSIKVVKVWEGNGPQSEIRVSLWRSYDGGAAEKYGDTITLNDSNNWTYTWKELPQKVSEGSSEKTYTYAVREEKIPVNYVSNITYEYGSELTIATITNVYDSECADESYYIANVLQTENWTMNKIWDDSTDDSNRPEELDVTVNGMTFTLSGDSNWTKTVTVLKKANRSYMTSENLTSDIYEQVNKVENVTASGIEVTFVNRLKTKSITVHKDWVDGEITDRPESITFDLYYSKTGNEDDWQLYDHYTMTEENRYNDEAWTLAIDKLPVSYKYKVVEVNVSSGYLSEVTAVENAYTIINTLKWSARKVEKLWSAASEPTGLSGAEFELKADDTVLAEGVSGENGSITWTVKAADTDLAKLNGTFKIVETKAPKGYEVHEDGWNITFVNGLMTEFDGKAVAGDSTNGIVIELENREVYELPSTGGMGIFWYTIGGMVLMMAAALIMYKKRCGELLDR